MRSCWVICALALAMVGPVAFSEATGDAPPLPNRQEGTFIARDFRFQSGETLPELKLGYTTFGTPQRDSGGNITNAVLLLYGTTQTVANS